MRYFALVGVLSAMLAACGGASNDADTSEPEAAAEEVAIIPESLAPFGDGYPQTGSPCRNLGENAATSKYLDDSATLVGCPSDETAAVIGGKIVGNFEGVRIVSVPTGDANAGMPSVADAGTAKPASKRALKDPIRSPGGLETKCLSRVNEMTGGNVVGTRRIDEAESGVMIYVNVEGAQAPWQCFGNKDGSLQEVYYGGSEGDL